MFTQGRLAMPPVDVSAWGHATLLLALLLSAKEDFAFAEERRVFYVALTRTKNRIYILTPTKAASVFLEDLPMSVQESVRDETDTTAYCPKCKKGHLVV